METNFANGTTKSGIKVYLKKAGQEQSEIKISGPHVDGVSVASGQMQSVILAQAERLFRRISSMRYGEIGLIFKVRDGKCEIMELSEKETVKTSGVDRVTYITEIRNASTVNLDI